MSAYSALSQGHGHPRILQALRDQAERVTLTSRAFRNDRLPVFCRELAQLCRMEMVLPMNTGAEAVETAIKAARRWGQKLLNELRQIQNPVIREIRGRSLLVGIELTVPARPYCEQLMKLGLLCKETHERVIRLAPPLIISSEDLAWAAIPIKKVFCSEIGHTGILAPNSQMT